MKIRFYFKWQDQWVGRYIDDKKQITYYCPFPCCVIEVRKENKNG